MGPVTSQDSISKPAKRIVWNAVTNYARFAAVMVSMLVLTPCIVKHLGTDDYGLWMLLACIVGYFELFDLGLATATVKFIGQAQGARDPERRDVVASTILLAYLILGGVVFGCTLLAAAHLPGILGIAPASRRAASIVLLILGSRVALNLPLSLFLGILFGQQQIAIVNVVRCAAYLGYSCAAWTALSRGGDIITLATLHGGIFFVEHVGFYLLCRRTTPDLRLSLRRFDPETLRRVLSFSLFALLTNLAVVALLKTDPMVVHAFQPLAWVGVYALAAKVSGQVLALTKQVINVFTPVYAELHAAADPEERKARIQQTFLSSTRYALAALVLLALPVMVWARQAMVLWVGEDFAVAGPVLSILLAAVLFRVMHESATNVLAMTGAHRFVAGASVIAAALNLLLSIWWIQSWGLTGAAFATFVSTAVVSCGLVLPRLCTQFDISLQDLGTETLRPLLLPAASEFVLCYVIQLAYTPSSLAELAPCILLPALVFLACFWLTALSASERAGARAMLRLSGWLRSAPHLGTNRSPGTTPIGATESSSAESGLRTLPTTLP